MEYLDERIARITAKQENTQQVVKTWDEQLAEVIESIPKLYIDQSKLEMEMKKCFFFEELLTVYIPADFVKMSSRDIQLKYPHASRPQLVLRNIKDTVNIGFSVIDESVEGEDLAQVRDHMADSFLAVNPSSSILDSGEFVQAETETTIAYYAFPSFAIGGQMYNLVFITPMDGKLLVCNLNCAKKDTDIYKLLFYGIMKTCITEMLTCTTEISEISEIPELAEISDKE